MLTLVVGFPKVHWLFTYQANGEEFVFDSEPILRELGDVPLTEPAILSFLREVLCEGVRRVQETLN